MTYHCLYSQENAVFYSAFGWSFSSFESLYDEKDYAKKKQIAFRCRRHIDESEMTVQLKKLKDEVITKSAACQIHSYNEYQKKHWKASQVSLITCENFIHLWISQCYVASRIIAIEFRKYEYQYWIDMFHHLKYFLHSFNHWWTFCFHL